jgi:hypothetical protein
LQPWPRLALWLGLLGLTVITGLGVHARLYGLDHARVVMDALRPFLRALAIVRGDSLPWRGAGGDFRFGALQTWCVVPLVLAAGGVRDMLWLYAVVHALGIPAVGLAGQRLGGWLTGLGAAGLYALWPVFTGHAHRGAQTYLAPVALALAAWVVVRLVDPPPRLHRGRGVALGAALGALLALAVHQHPYAIAPAAAAVVLLPWIIRRRGRGPALAMAISGGLLLLPMVVDNALLLHQRHSTGVGTSLVQDPMMLQETLGSLLRDASIQGLGNLSQLTGIWPMLLPLAALPLLLLPGRKPPAALPFAAWTTAAWALLLVVAELLGYLQPYHLAVVLPLHVVLCAWACMGLLTRIPVPTRAPFLQLRFVLGVVVAVGLMFGTTTPSCVSCAAPCPILRATSTSWASWSPSSRRYAQTLGSVPGCWRSWARARSPGPGIPSPTTWSSGWQASPTAPSC